MAFPQGVEQIRDDMLSIVHRLGNDVGDFTQSMEKDVIESLEELVTALQSEIENRKKPERTSAQRRQRGQRRRRKAARRADCRTENAPFAPASRQSSYEGNRSADSRRASDSTTIWRRNCRDSRIGRPKSRKPPTSSPRDETDDYQSDTTICRCAALSWCSWSGTLPAGGGHRRLRTALGRGSPQELMRWLTQHGFSNEKTVASIVPLWAAGGGRRSGRGRSSSD